MTLARTHRKALDTTLAADPILSAPEHAGLVTLARSLADELDAQTKAGTPQTRTQATYSGQLAAIRRVIRDERERQRREGGATSKPASRLAALHAQVAKTGATA